MIMLKVHIRWQDMVLYSNDMYFLNDIRKNLFNIHHILHERILASCLIELNMPTGVAPACID